MEMALRDHVAELRALGTSACSLPEALRFIRERVHTLEVAPERPRPGHPSARSSSDSSASAARNT